MNAPLLFLCVATGIFWFLAEEARQAFAARLASLLPRTVVERHLQVLLREFRQACRSSAAGLFPFSALHIVYNAAACGTLCLALWYTPPAGLPPGVLFFLRYAGAVVVPLAFVADVVLFARVLTATFARPLPCEEPESSRGRLRAKAGARVRTFFEPTGRR